MKKLNQITVSIVVSYTYPYIGSGIGNVAQEQAERLVKDGIKVYLLSSNFPQTLTTFIKNGVTYVKFPALFFLEKIHVPVPITLLSIESIKKIMKSDIVHVHDGLYLSSFFSALLAKIFRKKLVVTVHINHITYSNPIVNFLEHIAENVVAKPIFILANKILIINEKLIKELQPFHKKTTLLLNGVNTSLFHSVNTETKLKLRNKYAINPDKKIVLFVGRLVPKKGYKLLLESISNDYDIVFVGGGVVTEEMRKTDGVVWVGAVSQEKLAEYYQLSDVFVLPSEGEGYPLSIVEALSSGLPVVTTFSHSSLTILINKLLFIVRAQPREIKETLSSVLSEPTQVKYEKERQNFLNAFSWQKNVADLEKIYKDLI